MCVTVTVQARQSSHAMTRKTIEQESNGVARARQPDKKKHEEAVLLPQRRAALGVTAAAGSLSKNCHQSLQAWKGDMKVECSRSLVSERCWAEDWAVLRAEFGRLGLRSSLFAPFPRTGGAVVVRRMRVL